MPNHVHVLLEPSSTGKRIAQQLNHEIEDEDYVELSKITHALKSYTANRANGILNRKGTFWQDESYDHWVRNEREFMRIIRYIENNPVKAGLAASPEKWRWSSAAFERDEDGAFINTLRTG